MENQSPEYVFTELGGSIGRNPLNDWVICDHKRFISGKHAEIFFQDNKFFLTDTSTNGVYLNDGNDPIGKGNSIPLSDNDQLSFGELQISVQIESQQSASDNFVTPVENVTPAAPAPGDDLFADLLGDLGAPAPAENQHFEPIEAEPDIDQLIGASSTPDITPDEGEIIDPLAILDGKSSGSSISPDEELIPDDFSKELLDGGPGLNTPFNPSISETSDSGSSAIPDNWDPLADLLGDNAAPQQADSHPVHRNDATATGDQTLINSEVDILDLVGGDQAVAQKQPKTQAPPAQPATAPQQAARRTASHSEIDTILAAAGLNPAAYSEEQKQKLPNLVGAMLRGCLDGLVTALMARNQVKSGLRMAVTTIAPVENNPLKFSVNGEEALRNLINAREGYLGPKEAISEGYQDLQIHQLAMMSATQKTLQALVQRFNPDHLARQFEQTKTSGLKLGTKKMHYWDQYGDVYKNIEETINEDFQNLLGDVFADAYEEQTMKAKQNL